MSKISISTDVSSTSPLGQMDICLQAPLGITNSNYLELHYHFDFSKEEESLYIPTAHFKLKICSMKRTQWTQILISKLLHDFSLLIKKQMEIFFEEEISPRLSMYSPLEDSIRLLTSDADELKDSWWNEIISSMVKSKRGRTAVTADVTKCNKNLLLDEDDECSTEEEEEALMSESKRMRFEMTPIIYTPIINY